MTFTLNRTDFTPDGIFGELSDSNGKLHLVTAEHSYDGKPKVPAGVYTCVRGTHRLHDGVPFETFQLEDVPGHSNILLHKGNYANKDSDGCILLGMDMSTINGEKMITHSVIAFSKFMSLLENQNSFTLIIK